MFVTLFYGVLDAGRGRLVYVNAGHNPPLLFRAASETFTELPATGIAVGVDVDAAYRADEAELGPGDLLVLYTDGITEAENPAGEMFGEERLRGAVVGARGLPAGGVLDSVIGTVRAFAGDAPQADDITLMIVRAT
jgi:sigma-B regulation protein RsbU (phosphoserine phosphatase)